MERMDSLDASDGSDASDASTSRASVATRAFKAVAMVALGGVALARGAIPCVFARLPRAPCPGCGLTRASRELLRGEFVGALHHHPLVWLVLPLVAFEVARQARGYVLGRRANVAASPRARAAVALVAVLALAVWIARFFGALGGPEPV
jgi:hypothetical protein